MADGKTFLVREICMNPAERWITDGRLPASNWRGQCIAMFDISGISGRHWRLIALAAIPSL
jgi:hypothetical protein